MTAAIPSGRSRASAIFRVTSGNFLEQFDFFLFGFYATQIAAVFFPASSEFAYQLIAGVEYALSPQWRLTADTRWLRVGSVRLDNEVANAGGTAGPLTYNPFSVQVGVRYSF